MVTRWPGATSCTPGPTASTSPATSHNGTNVGALDETQLTGGGVITDFPGFHAM
jgi:hypothetical protein